MIHERKMVVVLLGAMLLAVVLGLALAAVELGITDLAPIVWQILVSQMA
jgi:hypothetical protein